MEYYLGSTAFFYIAVLLSAGTRTFKYAVIVGMLPMIALALLRGNVGVDTAFYLFQIRSLLAARQLLGQLEPLFEATALLFGGITNDARTILALFGLLCTAALIVAGLRLERKPWIFALAIVPQFYFDMTMNGIRYGISFSLVYLAASFLVLGKRKIYWLVVATATLFQLSGGAMALLLYALVERRWRAIVYGGIGAMIIAVVFRDYLLLKMEAYAFIQIASGTAGLVPLSVCLLTLLLWVVTPALRRDASIMIFTLLALSLMAFFISRFTYAGLRFLELLTFLIFVALACHLRLNNIRLRAPVITMLCLIGVIGFAFKLRNFQSGEYLESPFIPYHFYWEAEQ